MVACGVGALVVCLLVSLLVVTTVGLVVGGVRAVLINNCSAVTAKDNRVSL